MVRKCIHGLAQNRSKRETPESEYEDDSEEVTESVDVKAASLLPKPLDLPFKNATALSSIISARPEDVLMPNNLHPIAGLITSSIVTGIGLAGITSLIASHNNAPLFNGTNINRENQNRNPPNLEPLLDLNNGNQPQVGATATPSKTTRKPRRKKKPSRKKIGPGRLRGPMRTFGRR